MTCALCCHPPSKPSITVKAFVEHVSELWSTLSRHMDERSRRLKVQQTTSVEFNPQDDLPSESNAQSVERMQCRIEDVKDITSADGTVALRCVLVENNHSLRLIMNKKVLSSAGYPICPLNVLQNEVLTLVNYNVLWRAGDEGGPSDGGTIIEVQRCADRKENVSSECERLDTNQPVHDETSALRVNESPVALPLELTPNPLTSHFVSVSPTLKSQENSQDSEDLGDGLDESSGRGNRPSASTPVPLPCQRRRSNETAPSVRSLLAPIHEDLEEIEEVESRANSPPSCLRNAGPPRKVKKISIASKRPGSKGTPAYQPQRSKRGRDQLPSYDCDVCRDWHEGIAECFPGLASDVLRVGQCQCSVKRPGVVSRHRFAAPPASTPSGYWDVAFPETQDSAT
eukprot:Blabericola_migrator_1__12784@NODE_821_length_6384_cov_57_760329_g579_i0_p3_GENE_NODE_821_length_6384_cov_57_760329_g579_i0NODE_821_length_6384_cov_57_760329_g579_i0_p3_ORF_typecomplete_len399_score39_07SAE2/PF08573_10/1_3e04SAE2/PF08573_10/3_5e02SAE2/PF08573_10/4_2e05_NODE_821_length_6384_cov_57_760329_g579_i038195015